MRFTVNNPTLELFNFHEHEIKRDETKTYNVTRCGKNAFHWHGHWNYVSELSSTP